MGLGKWIVAWRCWQPLHGNEVSIFNWLPQHHSFLDWMLHPTKKLWCCGGQLKIYFYVYYMYHLQRLHSVELSTRCLVRFPWLFHTGCLSITTGTQSVSSALQMNSSGMFGNNVIFNNITQRLMVLHGAKMQLCFNKRQLNDNNARLKEASTYKEIHLKLNEEWFQVSDAPFEWNRMDHFSLVSSWYK